MAQNSKRRLSSEAEIVRTLYSDAGALLMLLDGLRWQYVLNSLITEFQILLDLGRVFQLGALQS